MKYIGSKNKIAKYILPFIEPYYLNGYTYWEPFCGGSNMLDKIPDTIFRYASDGNKYLIAMWKALQDGWTPPDIITKKQYEAFKELKDLNCIPDHILGFIGHNCSFSGDWFAGYAGTNEPNRNRCLEAKNNVLKQIKNLQRVNFYCEDYKDPKSLQYSHHVIYCDPPYYNGFKYKGSFYEFNHEEFWDWCRTMAKNDNIVFISDYYAPEDFELLWEQEVKINAHQTNTKTAIEKLYKVVI